jgi:hypothetical protein
MNRYRTKMKVRGYTSRSLETSSLDRIEYLERPGGQREGRVGGEGECGDPRADCAVQPKTARVCRHVVTNNNNNYFHYYLAI